MHRAITINVRYAAVALLAVHTLNSSAEVEFCSDQFCKKIEGQYFKKEYAEITALVDPKEEYSEDARFYIGMSYIVLAENATTMQEKENLYRRAILLKYYPAYMGLYNVYYKKDAQKAEEVLREYIKIGPSEPSPFIALGNIEFHKHLYREADKHLRLAKSMSDKHTAELDWMLFKTNYVLGNYEFAAKMFSSALSQSKLTEEILSIRTDSRFHGIEKRSEFRQYKNLLIQNQTKSNGPGSK